MATILSNEIIQLKSLHQLEQWDIADSKIILLNGRKAANWNSLYKLMSKLFNLPDYFGKNQDALFDCLCDLSWLPETQIIFVIENMSSLFRNEKNLHFENITDLILLIQDVIQEWEESKQFNKQEYPLKNFCLIIVQDQNSSQILKLSGIKYKDYSAI